MIAPDSQFNTGNGVIDVDGCRLAFRVVGDGPPVLFVQGVGVQGDGWVPQTTVLSADFRCLTFDSRGLGASQPGCAGLTVSRMARDALALLDAQGWPSAHVVGHSLGGLVAAEMALVAPRQVRSLSLLCTFADGRRAARSVRMMWIGARTVIGTRGMRRRAFLEIVYPLAVLRGLDRDALATRVGALFGHDLAVAPPVTRAQIRAMRSHDVTPRLGLIAHIPTLVISGAHDPIAPPDLATAWTTGIPDARLVILPDVAHGAPIQCAEEVNQLLRDHIAGADRAFRESPNTAGSGVTD